MHSLGPAKPHETTAPENKEHDATTRLLSARPALRLCRTPDRKRTVAAWMLYEDVNARYPLNAGFEVPRTALPRPNEVQKIEGKGRGMIATCTIKNGELIVRERPALLTPVLQMRDSRSNWWVLTTCLLQLLYQLDQEEREKVLQLSNCKPLDEYGPLAGLYLTNSLAAEFPWSKTCPYYGAICLEISYANHSCDQNAHYYFDEDSMTFSLRTIRDIAAGVEITISYIENDLPRAQRQRELREKYAFHCNCSRCSAPTEVSVASDKRRRFIYNTLNSLDDIAKRWTSCAPEERMALKMRDFETVQNLLSAIDEENLQTRRIEPLRQLAFMYAVLSDSENFTKAASECLKALEATKDWKEDDAKWYSKWKEWVEKPESFPAWGLWS